MQYEIQWILDALETNPEKSRAGIAHALNVDKSAITRMLQGKRQLKFSEVRKIAQYLGAEPPLGFHDDKEPFTYERAAGNAIIYACRTVGAGIWGVNKNTTASSKPRDSDLQQAPLAFGVFVPDSVMAPRFKIGELLWIDPAKPAGPGDDAVVTRHSGADAGVEIFPCEIRAIDEQTLLTYQYGRKEERAFDLSEWKAYRILPRR